MNCQNCGNELSEGSLFCNKCGFKIEVEEVIGEVTEVEQEKDIVNEVETAPNTKLETPKLKLKNILKNKKVLYITIAGVVIVIGLGVYSINYNNPYSKFQRFVSSDNVAQAQSIMVNATKENDTAFLNKSKTYLSAKLDKIMADFKDEKTPYATTINSVDKLASYSVIQKEINDTKAEINKINNSRVAFVDGKAYFNTKQYEKALSNLKNVDKDDKHYKEAQDMFEEALPEYKSSMLAIADKYYNSKDFQNAIDTIIKIETYVTDSDVTTKEQTYKSEKEKADKAAAEQREQRKNQLLASAVKFDDPVSKEVFYNPQGYGNQLNFPRNGVVFYPYLRGAIGNNVFKLIAGFNSDDWVFMKSILCNADGYTFTINFNYFSDRKDEVGFGSGVYEWIEIASLDGVAGLTDTTNPKLLDNLLKLATAGSSQIRFQGDTHYLDFTLTQKQKNDLANFIELYRMTNTK